MDRAYRRRSNPSSSADPPGISRSATSSDHVAYDPCCGSFFCFSLHAGLIFTAVFLHKLIWFARKVMQVCNHSSVAGFFYPSQKPAKYKWRIILNASRVQSFPTENFLPFVETRPVSGTLVWPSFVIPKRNAKPWRKVWEKQI
jgi:hypothetical protein